MGIKIQFNGAGLAPVAPIIDIPRGVYKAKVLGVKSVPNKNDATKTNAQFDLALVGGEYEGVPVSLWLSTDTSKPFVARQWKTALLSTGASADKFEGAVNIDTDAFVGKTVHLNNEKGATADDYDNRMLITPQMFESMKSMKPSGATATGAQTAAAASGNGATIPTPTDTAKALDF